LLTGTSGNDHLAGGRGTTRSSETVASTR
jgi:hypothetical protein